MYKYRVDCAKNTMYSVMNTTHCFNFTDSPDEIALYASETQIYYISTKSAERVKPHFLNAVSISLAEAPRIFWADTSPILRQTFSISALVYIIYNVSVENDEQHVTVLDFEV